MNAVRWPRWERPTVAQIEEILPTLAPVDDPGRGFWDGRLDLRTGYPTECGVLTPRYRLRAVHTSHCPSGPCGFAWELVRLVDPEEVRATEIAARRAEWRREKRWNQKRFSH